MSNHEETRGKKRQRGVLLNFEEPMEILDSILWALGVQVIRIKEWIFRGIGRI
jgi:hypothetical protein